MIKKESTHASPNERVKLPDEHLLRAHCPCLRKRLDLREELLILAFDEVLVEPCF